MKNCFNTNSKEYKKIEDKYGNSTHFILNAMKVSNIPTLRQVNSFVNGKKKETARLLYRRLRSGEVYTADQIAANLKGIIHKHQNSYFITKGSQLDTYDRIESERTIFEPNLKIMRAFEKQFPDVFSITKVGRFKNTFRVDIKPNTKSFDVNLAQEIQDKLEKLYPEIKLNITNNPVWEQGDNVFNQEEYNNQVNYRLRAVDILTSKKAEQIFEKGKKNNWSLDKILSELQVPKEQKQIILNSDFGGFYTNELSLRDNIVMSLMTDNSFVVEVNTAMGLTRQGYEFENSFTLDDREYTEDGYTNEYWYTEDGKTTFISRDKFLKASAKASNQTPTKHYENLTVLGGTNYTENEIATPAIIPNIRGHAQFSTDNGIGWFRSDEQDKTKRQPITSASQLPDKFDGVNNYTYTKTEGGWLQEHPNYESELETDTKELIEIYNYSSQKYEGSKTRRILEVQSDLFQKGRGKEFLVRTLDVIPNPQEALRQQDATEMAEEFSLNGVKYMWNDYYDSGFKVINNKGIEITKEEYSQKLKENNKLKTNPNQNQFLQLLNQKNNWVTFFVKSIIQDSAKKGYEKVLFPKGDTASKIEGHQTLEEFKKQKEARIKELKKRKEKQQIKSGKFKIHDLRNEIGSYEIERNGYRITNTKKVYFNQAGLYVVDSNTGTKNYNSIEEFENTDFGQEAIDFKNLNIKDLENEIKTLKQELADVESGQTQLSSIANFYETTITNILKKNGYNPVEITDEYGNKWNEIIITPELLSEILLQKNEANQIIGQANIKAMTVLIDAVNQKQDTLPHEYAHHYIAWYRNTPIVQEAIKKWGSEEALVQSIGEQVVAQKGEAYNWWNKFVKWIMNQFNSVSKLDRDRLTKILTDAFLTRQDLNIYTQGNLFQSAGLTESGIPIVSLISQEEYNELSQEEIEAIKKCN